MTIGAADPANLYLSVLRGNRAVRDLFRNGYIAEIRSYRTTLSLTDGRDNYLSIQFRKNGSMRISVQYGEVAVPVIGLTSAANLYRQIANDDTDEFFDRI